jgi:hypothetical protein
VYYRLKFVSGWVRSGLRLSSRRARENACREFGLKERLTVESYHHTVPDPQSNSIKEVVDDTTKLLDGFHATVLDVDVPEDLRENDDRKGF